jgi:hypothetical protein
MTPVQKLAQVINENAMLRSRLRAAGLLAPPADLPNADEVSQLLTLVETTHPVLRPAPTEEKTFSQHFVNALHYLAFAYRKEDFSRYSASVFLDEASSWLSRFEIAGGTSLKAFMAAVVVSHVRYSPLNQYPFGLELGLALGGSGQPIAAWRETLSAGCVPPPTEPKRHTTTTVQQLNLTSGIRSSRW